MEISNLPGWADLQRSDPTMGSELLLDNAEDFGLYLALTLATGGTEEVLSRNNIGMWNRSYFTCLVKYYHSFQNIELKLKT